MPTPTLKVLTEYCATYVDDERLNALAGGNMPLYAWRMWGYLRSAIPLFNVPPEMQNYLLGPIDAPTFVEPKFTSYQYVAAEEATSDIIVELGDERKGYELFSCHTLTVVDDFGTICPMPYSGAVYDAEAGTVTLKATPDAPIAAGTTFEMDFYTDGAFEKTLTPSAMNILALCFRVVWLLRFNTDWVAIVSKIEDKSFTVQNIANKERADRETLEQAITQMSAQMRRFEQTLVYNKTFPQGRGLL